MAKSKLAVKMTLKPWAKPVVFALCYFGIKGLVRKWMFNFKISAES